MNLPPECLAELEAARAALTAELRAPERLHAGFKRGVDVKADGVYNEAEVSRQTHYECYHCGSLWQDNLETRIALDRSSHYVPTKAGRPGYYGFHIPKWINPRVSWGSCMLFYLKADHAAKHLGNLLPLQEWVTKWCGLTWSESMSRKAPERPPMTIYDTKDKVPGELGRIASCDCQFNLTHLIYQAWAIGDGIPPRLLHYEWVKPATGLSDDEARSFCKNRVRALNKEFNIEPQNFMLDGGHRIDLVREWCAEDHVVGKIKSGNAIRQKVITYQILIGDDRASWRWEHPGRKHTLERFKQKEPPVWVDIIKDGKRLRVPVQHQLWSNPSIKDIAARWRDGDGAPKIQIHEKFLQDTSDDGLWKQLNSERLVPWKGRPGKSRWDNEGRPNHAWDGFCMVFVRLDQLGLLNTFGPPQEEQE